MSKDTRFSIHDWQAKQRLAEELKEIFNTLRTHVRNNYKDE